MIAHYEKRASHPPLEKIQILADALDEPVMELIGEPAKKRKNTSASDSMRSMKKLRLALILTPQDRLQVYRIIDLLIQKPEYAEKRKALDIAS